MAVPARRTSKTRKATRRSHQALVAKNLVKCSNCGEMIPPHQVCSACGFYGGKNVIKGKSK